MKAVFIKLFGDVSGLVVADVPRPPLPKRDRVRVRVHAAALNRADILQRLGRYPAPPGYPQEIPGLEFAGEVEATGPQVQNSTTGDRVFGITAGGAQAEYVVVPEKHLAKIPPNLDWISAAAVPEVFVTAHDALFTRAGLKAGESVLIHAVGSGVGTAAMQLAKSAPARVFGTARTPEKLARAELRGLRKSLVVFGDPISIAEAVNSWTGGVGVNVILDLVGSDYLGANLLSLATEGRMVLVGTPSGSKATLDFGLMLRKRLTLIGTVLRSRSESEKAEAMRLFSEQVVPLLAKETVSPVIDSIFKLNEVREAHRLLESNQTFGKVILLFD